MRFICLFSVFLLLVSCSKEEDQNKPMNSTQSTGVPNTIYGIYNVNTVNHTTSGNYLWVCKIDPNNSNSVYLVNNSTGSVFGDTLLIEVDNDEMRIPAQTRINPGWVGGTYTVTGTGYYSEPQFMMSIAQTFSATPSTTYYYSMIGIKP